MKHSFVDYKSNLFFLVLLNKKKKKKRKPSEHIDSICRYPCPASKYK